MLIRQIIKPTMDFIVPLVSPDYLPLIGVSERKLEDAVLLVATDQAMANYMGCIFFIKKPGEKHAFQLVYLEVVCEYREHGLGRQLMEQGIETVKQMGGEKISAIVFPEDAEISPFLSRFAFCHEKDDYWLTYELGALQNSKVCEHLDFLKNFHANIEPLADLPRGLFIQTEKDLKLTLEDFPLQTSFGYIQNGKLKALVSYTNVKGNFIIDHPKFWEKDEKARTMLALSIISYCILHLQKISAGDAKVTIMGLSGEETQKAFFLHGKPSEKRMESKYLLRL